MKDGETNGGGSGPRKPLAKAGARARGNGIERARTTLITGGAGFIGANLAHRLLSSGRPVVILDDLSRAGVARNVDWLRAQHGEGVQLEIADIRDRARVASAVARAGRVYHFAAQTAVTTSMVDPLHDFQVNAGGTLVLLECLRAQAVPPPLLFTSTNKVYGGLDDVPLQRAAQRYEPVDARLRRDGVSEERPIDFHSPYGCSKGAADHYVLDYARTFELPAVVFRMSCIYGPHQLGTEDQGWVAHFLRSAFAGAALTIYGDGMQVRDVLFIDDLLDALLLALDNVDRISGQVFNIGGGPQNTLSLLELLELMGELRGSVEVTWGDWRPGDQRYYVSDIRRFGEATGWRPRVGVREGIARLHAWLAEQPRPRAERAAPPAAMAQGRSLRR